MYVDVDALNHKIRDFKDYLINISIIYTLRIKQIQTYNLIFKVNQLIELGEKPSHSSQPFLRRYVRFTSLISSQFL